MTKHTFPIVPDIGLVVHDTFETSFKAFDKEWIFNVRSQSEANIAKGCLTYYKAMWDATVAEPVSNKDIILDVGAHIGFFSIPIASRVGHVVSLEPAPANFELLQRNVKRNNTHFITCQHTAMSRIDGQVELNLGVQGTTGHSVTSKKRSGLHTTVNSLTLETAVTKWHPTVLKLDCEGAEWEILTEPHWLTGIRMIVGELHKVNRNKLEKLEQVLRSAGMQFHLQHNRWFSKLIAYKEL